MFFLQISCHVEAPYQFPLSGMSEIDTPNANAQSIFLT